MQSILTNILAASLSGRDVRSVNFIFRIEANFLATVEKDFLPYVPSISLSEGDNDCVKGF